MSGLNNRSAGLFDEGLIQRLRYSGNICISGLTASGKTTHTHLLAGEFGLTYVSGSQIQLNLLGVSPIQTRDFWITAEAKRLWNEDDFNKIDTELLRVETDAEGFIFDTSTMPWRHRRPALCIWLESDLRSRVIKSIVSHRGRGQFSSEDYSKKIVEKDKATTTLYKKLYNIDIGADLSCFDLVIDISSLISEPSLNASLTSINTAHRIIRAATAYYLTRRDDFWQELQRYIAMYPGLVIKNTLRIT